MQKRIRQIAVLAVAATLVGFLTYFDQDDGLKTEIEVAPYGKIDIVRFGGKTRNVIIYFSDDKGWRKELQDEAWGEAWPSRIVAGIDLPQFRRAFTDSTNGCADYAGAVASINAAIAHTLRISPDEEPFLVGVGDGAAIAYAAAAQSAPDKIQGVVGRDFCPLLREAQPPCAGNGKLQHTQQDGGFLMQPSESFQTPLVAVTDPATCKAADLRAFTGALADAHIVPPQPHNVVDLMVSVVTQTNERTSSDPTVTVAALEDLPIVEVPPVVKSGDDRLAIVLTGDGGWADIDKTIGEELAKQGVAVIGFNSLKYFWEQQTPEEAAADLQRVIRHYTTAWHRPRVMLVGFSFGADILPFLYQRLAADIKKQTILMALLAPSLHASYEISVGGWVGVEDNAGPEVGPAVKALSVPVLCVQSTEESEHPCDGITKPNIETMLMKGDHHFDEDYAPIVSRILAKSKE